jgi:hypothetical protein
MRKFLGFVALFALGFAAGAYVLNTYFPQRDGVRRVVAAPAGETDAERVALTNLLEQRPCNSGACANKLRDDVAHCLAADCARCGECGHDG